MPRLRDHSYRRGHELGDSSEVGVLQTEAGRGAVGEELSVHVETLVARESSDVHSETLRNCIDIELTSEDNPIDAGYEVKLQGYLT